MPTAAQARTAGLVGLLRQSIYRRLAGYEDVNDADRLGRDPAMRWTIGGKAIERGGASTNQMGRFEIELLSMNDNLATLADLSGAWIDKVHGRKPLKTIVLDMDSSVSPTHGAQEGTAYNNHFACTCYHPLFVFNQFGDLECCALRPGNVHSAHDWQNVLEPVIARYRGKRLKRLFRGDAAFALPGIYEFPEAEDFGYAIRLPANTVLQGNIAHNAVWLQLHALAYNLGNFLRTLALPDAVERWSMTTLRERLIKIGGKIIRHGRYVTFQMAEVVIPRDLFADILRRIDRLKPKPAPA